MAGNRKTPGSKGDLDVGSDDEVDLIIADWRRERHDVDSSSIGTIGRIARLHAIQSIVFRHVHDRFSLSPAAFDVLASLRRSGPPYRKTAGELAESSLLSTGGITLRLDRLEAEGLVRRIRTDADRRIVYAELTPKGLRLIDRVFVAQIEAEQLLLNGLSESERQDLNELLRRLLRSFNVVLDQTNGRSSPN